MRLLHILLCTIATAKFYHLHLPYHRHNHHHGRHHHHGHHHHHDHQLVSGGSDAKVGRGSESPSDKEEPAGSYSGHHRHEAADDHDKDDVSDDYDADVDNDYDADDGDFFSSG